MHSVVTMAANVHELTPAAELLHGDEKVVHGVAAGFYEAVADYQGIAKRLEFLVKTPEFRVAMRPGKRRALPDTPEGKLQDVIETAKAHIRSKGEHPFRLIQMKSDGVHGNSSTCRKRGCTTWPRITEG